MKAINGKEKPFFIFEAIHKIFEINKDYRLYIAEKKGEIAAALLLFYYKDYCEYFTPAINQKFRSEQPLSMLIFYAMQEASLRGCHYWNWGGTWLSQDGVYLFKKRWGAEENLYGYYCMAFQQLRHSLTPQFYYVYPKKNI
jgi:lipid II:glycine glycyltransferase (peptidoglycan interpeptide bridge formation enzyme)